MKTMYSFLEVLGVLFILSFLFGCANVSYDKEAAIRHDFGNGKTYSFKFTPKR